MNLSMENEWDAALGCESQSLVSIKNNGWYICYLHRKVYSVEVSASGSGGNEIMCSLGKSGETFSAMSEIVVKYLDENMAVDTFTTARPLHVCIWTWASQVILSSREGL